jgi:hypothetical protein
MVYVCEDRPNKWPFLPNSIFLDPWSTRIPSRCRVSTPKMLSNCSPSDIRVSA